MALRWESKSGAGTSSLELVASCGHDKNFDEKFLVAEDSNPKHDTKRPEHIVVFPGVRTSRALRTSSLRLAWFTLAFQIVMSLKFFNMTDKFLFLALKFLRAAKFIHSKQKSFFTVKSRFRGNTFRQLHSGIAMIFHVSY